MSLRTDPRTRRPRKSDGQSGQSSVEAAFVLPVFFLVLLVLLQPGIVLYDRTVMQGAAAEGCRTLATRASSPGMSDEKVEELVKRRLGAIPQQDLFHVHEPCSYEVALVGDESSERVEVEVGNSLRPLPIVGAGMAMAGALDGEGNMRVSVRASAPTQPEWACGQGLDPEGWTTQREEGR